MNDGAPPAKYTFDKYNRPLEIPEYSDEEYSRLLHDPRWSKEETDYLFTLVRQYELRFIIMADRWALEKARSVEELKERYYAAAKQLLLARAPEEEDVAEHPLVKVRTLCGSMRHPVESWIGRSHTIAADAEPASLERVLFTTRKEAHIQRQAERRRGSF